MLDVEPKELTEAQREVVKMLRKWVDRAEKHGLEFAVVVACDNHKYAIVNHAGSLEYTFVANWGLDEAKISLRQKITERHLKPFDPDNTENADRVCWNMSHGPSCYDFISWMVLAEMNRIRAGAPKPLKIGFAMTDTEAERKKHEQLRAPFYKNVIFPAVGLMGVIDPGSNDAPELREYTFKEIVAWAKAGEKVPLLTPRTEAAEVMRESLGGSSPVTITLREADYTTYRNSNLPEWLKVAEHLAKQGERVIFVRDTDKAEETIEGFETCPAASTDINVRMALYEAAKCNLFVSNGPWTLALFGSRPWLMFVEPDALSKFPPETPQFWRQWHGIDPEKEEQAPWSLPTQRIIWKRDNADNIIAAWEALRPALG